MPDNRYAVLLDAYAAADRTLLPSYGCMSLGALRFICTRKTPRKDIQDFLIQRATEPDSVAVEITETTVRIL